MFPMINYILPLSCEFLPFLNLEKLSNFSTQLADCFPIFKRVPKSYLLKRFASVCLLFPPDTMGEGHRRLREHCLLEVSCFLVQCMDFCFMVLWVSRLKFWWFLNCYKLCGIS